MTKNFRIAALYDPREGVSAGTGFAWKSQKMKLCWKEEREDGSQIQQEQSVFATAFNEVVDDVKNQNIRPGDSVLATITFNCRFMEKSGFMSNDVQLNSIQKV